MEIKKVEIEVLEYGSVSELNTEDIQLVQKARDVVNNSYAPYSNFHVGAAILLENGEIITGTNQENAAYPSGLCAERVAMFYANSQYPGVAPVTIAITAYYKEKYLQGPVPPCGSCRQALLETEMRFKKPIRIILSGDKKVQIVSSVQNLLPLNFDESFLH